MRRTFKTEGTLTASGWPVSLGTELTRKVQACAIAVVSGIVVLSVGIWTYWSSAIAVTRPKTVVLPSVSQDLTLREELTFSSFAILSDVAGHFLRVGDDLSPQPGVVKSYRREANGLRYVIQLDPQYRSFRGEDVTADDMAFTFKHYFSNHKALAGVLNSIQGASTCKAIDCRLEGYKKINQYSFALELEKPDLNFIEKLSSPWLLIFKLNKPVKEQIGACSLPYQMGRALITACKQNVIEVSFPNETVAVTDATPPGGKDEVLQIVNDNPGLPASPTLTVLTLFANPESKSVSAELRLQTTELVRANAQSIADALKLRWSPLMTAKWLAVPTTPDLIQFSYKKPVSCPRQPIKVLLDTSLPNLELLKELLSRAVACPVQYAVTTADKYFERFKENDFGIAWFSPDYLDLYNEFSAFDCRAPGFCYFNWKDSELQKLIDDLRNSSQEGRVDKGKAIAIERLLKKKGYAAPFAEMNWWIRTTDGYRAIHPAGLCQVSISEFLGAK